MVQVFSSLDLICCFYLRVHSIVFRHHKLSPHIILATTTIQFINGTIIKDLGQFPRRKLPPIPKLTLSQTLTLTKGQPFLGAIVWLPPTLKPTLTLTQTPNLTGGQFFSVVIVRIPTIMVSIISQWKHWLYFPCVLNNINICFCFNFYFFIFRDKVISMALTDKSS